MQWTLENATGSILCERFKPDTGSMRTLTHTVRKSVLIRNILCVILYLCVSKDIREISQFDVLNFSLNQKNVVQQQEQQKKAKHFCAFLFLVVRNKV